MVKLEYLIKGDYYDNEAFTEAIQHSKKREEL
jgi:hypothetical protein